MSGGKWTPAFPIIVKVYTERQADEVLSYNPRIQDIIRETNLLEQVKLGKSKGILNPQGFARVLTKGKGKGRLYSTLAKPLPLPRVEGYWKGTARVLIHKCI